MAYMTCTAAGDAMVFRRLPGAYPGFEALRKFISRGDFRFFNLETTVHNFESYGAALSGGSWFCSQPEILEDAKKFGFNILTTANNHAMDYSYGGLERTLHYVRAAGFPCAGTGLSLAEASAPAYLDTLAGRFALLAATSTFYPDAMAGEQTRAMPGRPGVNGIRFETAYELPKRDMDVLRRIARETSVNGADDISRREGYLPQLPEGRMMFGPLSFHEGEKAGKITRVHQGDMLRMERAIREARYMADYVVVSMHSHELRGTDKEEPDQFFVEFAHRCIDAGAHAIVGTGPHLLRPIEIYKGCPIFYSLGDFIIQLETIQKAPPGMFEKQKMTGNEGLDEMLEARSDHGRRGLYYNPLMFQAVIPYWEAENGVLRKLTLLPIELHYGESRSVGGWPSPNGSVGILERLAEMSRPYGTEITINSDGLGVVQL